MLLSLIVIQLLAIVANAANLQASPYWNAVKSESELENMITSETRNVLVFYHVSNRKCADCDKYAKSLTDMSKTWQDAIRFVQIDCAKFRNSNLKNCSDENDYR